MGERGVIELMIVHLAMFIQVPEWVRLTIH